MLPGIACWSASRQLGREQMRSDWDAVKVDIMYRCLSLHVRALQHAEFLWQLHTALIYLPNLHAIRVNLAKYLANPGLQTDLLSTGHEAIVHPDSDFWGTWNGVIQVRGAAEVMCLPNVCSCDVGAWVGWLVVTE